ncbi:hypothetical protein ACK2SH_004482 [Yersinia enterocolitica]|uniref:hypothetical protein n=1 Tax=Yersinia enterocolitica TaxID=630 RepID=UPI00297B767A|nr:hypothetical protein [Yersinia enterocolitica]ELW8976974.1 hypothetical protein [Yersinia enterocolitica]HDM8442166.1 hypothetical protein [Yersinia enterocolitica]HEN3278022.1 hypothetical protein [Yersinia enterocolitica]
MMKLNISVELEWLGEDGELDAEVKQEIISGVKNAISRDCLAKVEKEASAQINQAINESISVAKKAIEQKAIKFADDWLEKEVTVTDKWGDVQDCLTITDLIKRSFDKTLEKKVDSSGNFSNDYNSMPLVKYLMGQRMEELVQAKIKPLQKDIDNAIANAVNAGIRKNVSDKFAEMIIQTAKQNNQPALEIKQ